MANGFNGQASVSYKGARYTLTLDFNALADFEGETGKDPIGVLDAYEKTKQITMLDLRALFWACLTQDHPDLTLKDAGRIMSANPDALMKALSAVSPQAADGKADGKTDEAAAPAGKRKARAKVRAS